MAGPAATRTKAKGMLERLVETLVDAFIDDPLYRWLFPDPTIRPLALRATMQLTLELARSRAVECHTPDGGAIAVWTRPHVDLLDDPEPLVRLLQRWAPNRVDDALAGMQACAQHRPPDELYELNLLAVSPEQQGRGIASALIRPLLDHCAEEQVKAYLESSNPQNLHFYRRHGFRCVAEVPIPSGGPVMFAMVLDPAAR